jgi:hypothetical protein
MLHIPQSSTFSDLSFSSHSNENHFGQIKQNYVTTGMKMNEATPSVPALALAIPMTVRVSCRLLKEERLAITSIFFEADDFRPYW